MLHSQRHTNHSYSIWSRKQWTVFAEPLFASDLKPRESPIVCLGHRVYIRFKKNKTVSYIRTSWKYIWVNYSITSFLFKDRGMIFRSLETIFEMAETAKEEKLYHVVLSMFEIRKDRIKDLLTLGDYELRQVGEFGPKVRLIKTIQL
jgi:hypothetical protein